jgi:pimeloyl-ACP methyl ester carboxylesterase
MSSQEFARKYFTFQNLKLSYLDTETKSNNPTILITHANGFSGGCYSYILKHFQKDYRVIAIDFCGHGQSEKSLEFKDWTFFRDQIVSLVETENLRSIIGIGHSLGGASILMASKLLRERFVKLILFDPTILNVPILLLGSIFGVPIAKNALKRRRDFKSLDSVRKTFRRLPFYQKWDEEIFEDYLQTCFQPKENGVELCCAPEMEAKIFSSPSIFSPLNYWYVLTESHVIIPENHGVCSPFAAKMIARKNTNSTVTRVKGFQHLFPFEEKEWTLNKIEQILNRKK